MRDASLVLVPADRDDERLYPDTTSDALGAVGRHPGHSPRIQQLPEAIFTGGQPGPIVHGRLVGESVRPPQMCALGAEVGNGWAGEGRRFDDDKIWTGGQARRRQAGKSLKPSVGHGVLSTPQRLVVLARLSPVPKRWRHEATRYLGCSGTAKFVPRAQGGKVHVWAREQVGEH